MSLELGSIRRKLHVVKIGFSIVVLLLVPCLTNVAQQPSPADSLSLSGKSRSELLATFADVERCGEDCRWDIADILGKPENKDYLLSEFSKTKNADRRLGIIYSLYRIDDPDVAAFYQHLIREKYDDGQELYYPLNYLAKRCDPGALRALSGNGKGAYKGYPGCSQWATTVELFGKCQYRAAIPYLIRSVNAACMNIGIAALDDLRRMYPGSPGFENSSFSEIEQYFRRKAAAEFPPDALAEP